jgi:non-ribosomal peptide synthetase component F
MRYIPFGKALSAKLRDFAQRQRTLLPLVVLAVFAAALSHWFKQRDFIIFFNSHGRYNRPELENMIGFLSSGLFLRMEIIERDSFHDLLQRTHLEFYSACKHQGAGLVPGIVPECTTDVVFNWNWLPRSGERKFNADGQVKIQPFPIQFAPRQWIRNEEAQIKLLTMFSDSAAGIVMTAGSGLFVPTTIERFGRSVRLFAEEFAERPLVRVSSVAFAR